MRSIFKAILTIAVVGGFIAASSSAQADFLVRVQTASGFDQTFNDGDLDGVINFNGSAGEFAITIAVSQSKPFQGSAANPIIHTTVVFGKGSSSLADTLTVTVTDTDFNPPVPGIKSAVGGSFTGNVNTIKMQSWADDSNAPFGMGGPTHPELEFTSSPFAGAEVFDLPGFSGSYSLTQRVIIDTGAGQASGSTDGDVTATPLPGALILVLTGVPALGLGVWARRRKATLAA